MKLFISKKIFTLIGLNVETRTLEELTEHYQIEKELANRLRASSREERSSLYSSVYDEHFQRVQRHLVQNKKLPSNKKSKVLFPQLLFLRRFLRKDTTFLEIGAGDCSVSLAVASHIVKKVYAAEVSAETTKSVTYPPNFELILFDGFNVPLPENSIDVIYSDQVMEHLHPDDALEQLKNIYKLLSRRGVYICVTPNRFTGPHDISKNFDVVATGFHLKEYTYTELSALFQCAGFSSMKGYIGAMGLYVRFPLALLVFLESRLTKISYQPFKVIAYLLFRPNIRLVGTK